MLNVSPTNRKSSLIKWGIKNLNLTTKGEIFVLKYIINDLHQNRYVVKYIENIKLKNGQIEIKMKTSKASNWFYVADLESEGWNKGMTQYEKESYIKKDIAHKTAYR
jgi:uncharacterized protein YpiB (UPF0302 family)